MCAVILTRLLFVGNWSDLHANGLRLLNDVGGSATTLFCALPLHFPACVNDLSVLLSIAYTMF